MATLRSYTVHRGIFSAFAGTDISKISAYEEKNIYSTISFDEHCRHCAYLLPARLSAHGGMRNLDF